MSTYVAQIEDTIPVASHVLTIRDIPKTIAIDAASIPANDTITTGTFTATVKNASSGVITAPLLTWSVTSGSDVIQLDNAKTGAYTVLKSGAATIKVVCDDDTTVTATEAFTVTQTPASVTITGLSASVLQDATGTAAATVKDKVGSVIPASALTSPLAWATNNSGVVSIDAGTGAWTAIAKGTANITATATAGGVTKVGFFEISVTNVPDRVEFTLDNLAPEVGDSATATATVKDRDGATIPTTDHTWVSNDTSVATITGTSGTNTAALSAVRPGNVLITLTSKAVGVTKTNTTTLVIPGVRITAPSGGSSSLVGTSVTFSSAVFGLSDPITYEWNITGAGITDDSVNSTEASFSYTFPSSMLGSKTVSLNATSGGKTYTDEITISITTTPPPVPTSTIVSNPGDGNMEQSFRVLFETSGGSSISPVTSLSYGDTISQPSNPTKTGYTFGGWYTDEACTTAWSFGNTIPGDLTLYAKWTSVSGTSPVTATATKTSGSAATTIATPASTPVPTASGSTVTATMQPTASSTMQEAPAPVAGALLGLLVGAGILLRRRPPQGAVSPEQ